MVEGRETETVDTREEEERPQKRLRVDEGMNYKTSPGGRRAENETSHVIKKRGGTFLFWGFYDTKGEYNRGGQ